MGDIWLPRSSLMTCGNNPYSDLTYSISGARNNDLVQALRVKVNGTP
jgi:hypothetical protein